MENVMEKSKIINSEELRMKIVNMLKNYGYYDGVMVKNGMDKKFVSGELLLIDIISSKKDFKELKMSIQKVLDYCYENNFGLMGPLKGSRDLDYTLRAADTSIQFFIFCIFNDPI